MLSSNNSDTLCGYSKFLPLFPLYIKDEFCEIISVPSLVANCGLKTESDRHQTKSNFP